MSARRRRRAARSFVRSSEKITAVNTSSSGSHRFILAFGAYGWTRLMVWANHFEDALDEAVDWIADHEPDLLVDDAVHEEYKRALAEGKSEEEAFEEAEVDTTRAGSGGHYLNAWEWTIVAEDPTREQILELEGRAEHRASGVDVLAKKARKHRYGR